MHRRTLLAALLLAPAVARAAGGGGDKGKGKADAYQRFSALAVSVPGRGRRHVMTVDAGVEATDPALAETVARSAPRLRAGWHAVLQRYAVGMRPGLPPDADALSKQLQAETDRVLGRKGAVFLIGSILVH